MIVTISEDYRVEQQRLHKNERYGVASIGYAPLVRSLLKIGRCASLSDYGAGKCNLRLALGAGADGIDYYPYDPAFCEYGPPREADLVVCIDVLEHIEPDMLEACLDDLASIVRRFVLVTVHTGPAKKVLSDGRNAHLIQEPPSWWLPRLTQRFDLLHIQHVRKGFFAVACPRGSYRSIERDFDLPAVSRAAARCEPRKANFARKTFGKLRNAAVVARRDVGALWYAARDRRTPWYVKLIAGGASATALSPIDLTPDFIPVVGYLDDLVLLALGTLFAVRLIPRPLMSEYRNLATSRRARTVRYGTMAVGSVWLMAAVMALLRASQPIAI